VQWTDGKYAGFSTAKPWFYINENYKEVNVAAQNGDPDSLLNFYRRLVDFKKGCPAAIWGDYKEYMEKSREFYVYSREYEGARILVICSFSAREEYFTAPEGFDLMQGKLIFKNYDMNIVINNGFTAWPYEVRVYYFD